MPRVTHFEIYADDPDRAVKFYTGVFGWEIRKWDGPMEYWLVMTGQAGTVGINGGLMKRQVPVTCEGVSAYVCTIEVDALDDFTAKVEHAGGKIIHGKSAIPGVGWFAQCRDTEGNLFGLMEEDSGAA